jgi:hypothetical protein
LGAENEKQLFDSVQKEKIGDDGKRELFCSIVESLPIPSQHLLVLLFGTFRVITDSADTFGTRMTPEAIGISVAPSLFHTCIHDGQRAKIEDVLRFKIASQVISEIIRGFSHTNLFPRECYEFYARITGRTLRIDEQWHFTFHLPSSSIGCYNPITVNRQNSRRSRRKSSSASSVASILSQLHSTQAVSFTTTPVQISTYAGPPSPSILSHLHTTNSQDVSFTTPVKSVAYASPPSPPFLTQLHLNHCHAVASTTPVQKAVYAGPPPPPPTSALQRRIDAYCAAANINPRGEYLQAHCQPQLKNKQNHKMGQSQQQLLNRNNN